LKILRLAGFFLIAIGLLFAANVIRMETTIIFPARFWLKVYPDGASEQNPTMITGGRELTVSAIVIYYDAQYNTKLPGNPGNWRLSVDVIPIGEDGRTIWLKYVEEVALTDGSRAYKFEGKWAPPNKDLICIFYWDAVIYDEQGNEFGRPPEIKTYAKVNPSTPSTGGSIIDIPDGVFYIMDKAASEISSVTTMISNLLLKFQATKLGEKITGICVDVLKENNKVSTVKLSGANPIWLGNATLPEVGTYILKGYFTWTGSDKPVEKMSILVIYSTQQTSPSSSGSQTQTGGGTSTGGQTGGTTITTSTPIITRGQVIGLASIIAGIFLIRRRRY